MDSVNWRHLAPHPGPSTSNLTSATPNHSTALGTVYPTGLDNSPTTQDQSNAHQTSDSPATKLSLEQGGAIQRTRYGRAVIPPSRLGFEPGENDLPSNSSLLNQ